MSELSEAAIEYAAAGLAVFPVKPGDKVPLTAHGLKDASADPERVAEWWRRWPDANIGLPTGEASGLVVLDIDTPKGGARTLVELERRHGKLPRTAETLTGGGGRHVLFRRPSTGLRNSTGALGAGVDVRGDGGYIVVPPSVHESGRPYKWTRAMTELSECPPWLRHEQQPRNGTAPEILSEIPEGRRNAELASLAGTLRRRGLDVEEIAVALLAINARRCQPPLPEEEVRTIAGSIGRYPPVETIGRPVYTGPASALEDTIAVFKRWLHLPDVTSVYAVIGAYAANLLPGDPVWLGLVAPPSSAKTEILNALSLLPTIHQASTLSPASLLSGSPKKDQAKGATGGLLRQIGDFGVIVFKDFGSVLSMRAEPKGETLAALREVYDGAWVRTLGADGGRELQWRGKVGLIFGVTPALDSHHAVMGAMGERFILCRCEAAGEDQALRAFEHMGGETQVMRDELAQAVAALFAGDQPTPRTPTEKEKQQLARMAGLAVRMRSTVERDRNTREIELVHGAEGPARMALALERLLAGLDTIGTDRATALAVVRRVALDSVPVQRRRVLEHVNDQGDPVTTQAVAEALDLPTSTARRALEDLNAYGLVRRSGKQGNADLWSVTAWAAERLGGSVPAMSHCSNYPEPTKEDIAGTEPAAPEQIRMVEP